jgi:hypothetical protein
MFSIILGLYVCAMEGLYLRCCRQMEKLNEISAEEAYRSDSVPSVNSHAGESQSLLLAQCLSQASYSNLTIILKCSDNPSEQGRFFNSNALCRVLSNDLSRAPILWLGPDECSTINKTAAKERHSDAGCVSNDLKSPVGAAGGNGGVYSICVGGGRGGTLVLPRKGFSLSIRVQEYPKENRAYSLAESDSQHSGESYVAPTSRAIQSLGLRFDLFVPPGLNIAATEGFCLPGLHGIVIASPMNVGDREPGSFLFDARFRIHTNGALVFRVTCSGWANLTHSPLSSESCVRSFINTSARVQRNVWQAFSIVVTDSAFIHATVDHCTIFAARWGKVIPIEYMN